MPLIDRRKAFYYMHIQALQIVTTLLGLSCGAVIVTFLMQKDLTFNSNIAISIRFIHQLDAVSTNGTLKSSIVSTFRLAQYIMATCSHTI